MTREFFTLSGGQSLLAGPPEDAPPADLGRGRLAGALAQQHRSALVALACPDLPPSALSGRGLHLQAQQRARCALGRHERACVSGYRPHLRAAATARAVMAVDAGLAPDEAAEARERQELSIHNVAEDVWRSVYQAARSYEGHHRAFKEADDYSMEESAALMGMRDATLGLREAVRQVDERDVAAQLAALQPTSAAEAEERQRTTALGPVLSQPLEGVSTPAWLLRAEAARMLPARAALLLHCHAVLGCPPVDMEEACKKCNVSISGDPSTPACGRSAASAALLAAALLRYWQLQTCGAGHGSGGGSGSRSGSSGVEARAWLSSDFTDFAIVMSALQALALWLDHGRGVGATGALAALTRPAVLLRVAAVLSHDVVAGTPPEHLDTVVRQFVMQALQNPVREAVYTVLGLDAKGNESEDRKAAAAVGGGSGKAAARAPPAPGTAASGDAGLPDEEAQGLLLERVRSNFITCQQRARKNAKAQIEQLAAAGRKNKAKAGCSEGAATVDALGEELANQRVLEMRVAAGERLVAALFDPLPPLLASTPPGVSGAAPRGGQDVAALAKSPPPPPPQPAQVVRMLWRQGSALLPSRTQGKAPPDIVKIQWDTEVAEVAGQAALARAMVGALAPCWEANMGCTLFGAAAPCANSLTACNPTYSPGPHSSLVLQGSPAICYSLARTAAVNYVLDRVARGMAAAAAIEAAAMAMAREGLASECVGQASQPLPTAAAWCKQADRPAVTAAPLPTVAAAATAARVASQLPRLPYKEHSEAVGLLVAAIALPDTLGFFHRAVGWPLVMTLSGSEEERAQHARQVPAELLKPLDPTGVETQKLGRVCLTANWLAGREPGRGLVAAAEATPATDGTAAGGGPAGGDTTRGNARDWTASTGGASSLPEAVTKRAWQSKTVSIYGGSPGAITRAVCDVDVEVCHSALRACCLKPSNAHQTAEAAAKLAVLSRELRSDAAAPRELVVVPLLEPGALVCDTDALRRLRGIVCLVLRDLTQPAPAAAGAAAPGIGAGAREQRPPAHCEDEDEATEAAAVAAAGFKAPRVLRPDWRVRMPLILNRALCRVLGVPLGAIRWQLSELSPPPPDGGAGVQQGVKQRPLFDNSVGGGDGGGGAGSSNGAGAGAAAADLAARLQRAAQYLQSRAGRGVLFQPKIDSAGEGLGAAASGVHVGSNGTAAAKALPAAQVQAGLLALQEALADWKGLDEERIAGDGDGGLPFMLASVSRSDARRLLHSKAYRDLLGNKLDNLVPCEEGDSGYQGMYYGRQCAQSLQLLIVEGCVGRPTELLAERPAGEVAAAAVGSRWDELD